jgi:hypothetical protein
VQTQESDYQQKIELTQISGGGVFMVNFLKKKNDIESFWKWFSKRESNFFHNFDKNNSNIVHEIGAQLRKIDDNIVCEISAIREKNGRDFVISADGIFESFDNVMAICNEAPLFGNWTITAFRPRYSSSDIAIRMGDVTLSHDNIYFGYALGDNVIDLDIYIDKYASDNTRYVDAYFILLDSLIGEFDAVTKIGDTNFHSLKEKDKLTLLEFSKLIDIIDALE